MFKELFEVAKSYSSIVANQDIILKLKLFWVVQDLFLRLFLLHIFPCQLCLAGQHLTGWGGH